MFFTKCQLLLWKQQKVNTQATVPESEGVSREAARLSCSTHGQSGSEEAVSGYHLSQPDERRLGPHLKM